MVQATAPVALCIIEDAGLAERYSVSMAVFSVAGL
jgi:hypothetical protein